MLSYVDPYGLLMMLLGVGVLWCMRDHASVQRQIEPKLFRLNHPRLARKLPTLPDAFGIASARTTIVIGLVVGVGAIAGGTIIAIG